MTNSTDSLYMSNLNYKTTEEGLKNAFPDSIRAQIVRDRETGNSRGFGFVQFSTPEEAQAQLDKVGGPGGTISIDGRDVKLNYAHSKDQKGGFRGGMRGGATSPRGGGGFRGGRGGGRGGGYGGYSGGYGGQGEYGTYGGGSYSEQGQSGGYGAGSYSSAGYDASNGYAPQAGSYSGQYGQQASYGQGSYGQADSSAYSAAAAAGNNWNYGAQSYGQTSGAGDYNQQQQGYGGGQQSSWSYQ